MHTGSPGSFTIFTMAYKLYRLLTILYSGCVCARCIYIQFTFYISHKCCSVLCNESIHATCCSLLSNKCCTSGNLCHNNPYPKISKSFSVSRIFNINVFQKLLLFFFPENLIKRFWWCDNNLFSLDCSWFYVWVFTMTFWTASTISFWNVQSEFNIVNEMMSKQKTEQTHCLMYYVHKGVPLTKKIQDIHKSSVYTRHVECFLTF